MGRVLQGSRDNYSFTAMRDKTASLIFDNAATVLKEHNLRRHYEISMGHQFAVLEVKQSQAKLRNLKPHL
jgi:hypothetical protein